MSAGHQRARQLVNASLVRSQDERKIDSTQVVTTESAPVITIPAICDQELDLAIKSIANQNTQLFDLPDNFVSDCSINKQVEQVNITNETVHFTDDVIIQELTTFDINDVNHQNLDVVCNQSSDDEAIPHNTEIVTALVHHPQLQSNNNNFPDIDKITAHSISKDIPSNLSPVDEVEVVTENNESESNTKFGVDDSIHLNLDLDDIDYIPIERDDKNSESNKRPKRGRKRKVVDQNRAIRKKRINTNQDYVSAKGKFVKSKAFIGRDYDCQCPKKCTNQISADEREKEFNKFWSAGSFEARCALLNCYVKECNKKRSYSQQSKRQYTRKYYMRDKEICKKTLLTTLNISQARIDSALTKNRNNETLNDRRGDKAGGKNSITAEQLKEMRDFIDSLPKYKSHYGREISTAEYLAPNLNLAILYEKYKIDRNNPVSFSRFRQCFMQDFNLKFKKPHKDTCLRCDTFKANISSATSERKISLELKHKEHLNHASSLRTQMKADLLVAKTDEFTETLTFDMEKTHSLPRLPTSIVYYKRQLNFYNVGIHCGSTGQGFFYVWLEHEAGRGTQEVGSCLRKFIKENLKPKATRLILWSDSAGGQNRSIKMVLILLHILQNHPTLESVTLRFLQPGHTFLPNDSEFGDVECALKTHTRLYTADDYIEVMKNCRRKNKFVVTKLTKNDFFSIAPIQDQITNRKNDVNKDKISWLKTFEIQLKKHEPTILLMKTNLVDEARLVDIGKGGKKKRKPINFNVDLPLLYPDGHERELSAAKIKDLKEVLKLIPADARPFYNFLKTIKGGDFTPSNI